MRELPADALSTALTDGVTAEICRDHLFDPGSRALRLPEGYRLHRAEELAATNAELAELLRLNPGARQHALGSLCLMSVASFVIDGIPVQGLKPLPVAFWWASAEGPRHARMRGAVRWVQIGSWYPRGSEPIERIRRTDPMAQVADILVNEAQLNVWHLRLGLPGETVTAEVRVAAQSSPPKSDRPGAMSVPMSGEAAGFFTVYAHIGHRRRKAEGTWQAQGGAVFSRAFSLRGEAAAFPTLFQEAWTAQSGLYRFANP